MINKLLLISFPKLLNLLDYHLHSFHPERNCYARNRSDHNHKVDMHLLDNVLHLLDDNMSIYNVHNLFHQCYAVNYLSDIQREILTNLEITEIRY